MKSYKLASAALAIALASGAALSGCSQQTEKVSDEAQPAAAEQPATRVVVDSNGNEVTIPYEVTKVAPTMGAFAQVTEMLGQGHGKIAATSTKQISDAFKSVFTDYDESNPNNYDASSVEDLIAAGVQVVYGPGSMYTDEQKEQIAEAGIALVELNKLSTVDDMCNDFLTIGEILGPDEYAEAQKVVEYYKKSISDGEARAAKISDAGKKTVLQLSVSGGAYTCANENDISAAYYDAVGAENVAKGYAGAQNGQYVSVDAEQIVAWNPDYIITMNADAKTAIENDAALAGVQAVQDGHVYVCPTALYLWCVRSAEGALMTPWLGTVIYPEQYADVDMTKVLQDFYQEFYNTDLSDGDAAKIIAGETSISQGGQGGSGGQGGQGGQSRG